MKIDLAKTCLAVLLGIVIGVVFMILIRPREVKAQGGTVFVDSVSVPAAGATSTVNIKGLWSKNSSPVAPDQELIAGAL